MHSFNIHFLSELPQRGILMLFALSFCIGYICFPPQMFSVKRSGEISSSMFHFSHGSVNSERISRTSAGANSLCMFMNSFHHLFRSHDCRETVEMCAGTSSVLMHSNLPKK